MAIIDHLVFAVEELGGAIDRFEQATGVRPAAGGAHVGMGTHNALVSFGSGYVELIAPDPGQPEPAGERPFGIDTLDGSCLVTFAVRPDPGRSIDDLIESAAADGFDPGAAVAMNRRTPTGHVLEWRLTFPQQHWQEIELAGAVPFLIDWGATPMPSTTTPGGVSLTALSVGHPHPPVIAAAHAALGGLDVEVHAAAHPGLAATLTGPSGVIEL